ncbi:MAG: helix-turn-helix transcriptional regulator [Candidatus Omnitrophica bacterium]|nr:helix-turn-helix transcriptional regulator [Candidatus Omnitrophota bacterium]
MNSNRVKRKKIVINDQDIISTKEVGRLFKKFRESIDKDQHELASELNNSQGSISRIESGFCKPKLGYLHYLYKKYRLNINWLLSGKGEMFILEGRQILVKDKKYIELIKLMQMPGIELLILAKLAETKIILKENIENYKKNEN